MIPTKNPFKPTHSKFVPNILAAGFLLSPFPANAGEPELAPKPPAAAESPYKFSGYLEGGFMGNFDGPSDDTNYGRLFDDRSNEPMLNQASLTFEKILAPSGLGAFDWGFKVQGLVGSDARFIHSLGLLDHVSDDLIQVDIPEAYLNFHFPVLTEGGLDLKLGKFVTLEGAETINPLTNVFYSHSYMFNFGVPLNHTGALFTLHTNKYIDLYAGVTRGVNTSIDDNNDSVAFHGGIGLANLCDGKLSVLASTHFGPETPGNNSDWRWLNDVVTTVKITDTLTSITDLNYAYDALADADAFGVAQYVTYALNDKVTLGMRGEIFRDDEGFYVTQFGNYADPVRLLEGAALASTNSRGAGKNTYVAITAGVTVKVNDNVMIRPEVRWDHATNNNTFNNFTDDNMLTAGLDLIVHF